MIGGGNTAVEEALYLSNIASEVILVHRRDKLKAEKIMQDKLFEKKERQYPHPLEPYTDEVLGDASGVTVASQKYLGDSTQDIDVPVCLSRLVTSLILRLFEGQLDMKNGYIVIRSGIEGNATATNIPGVFAAGDVADPTSIDKQ